MAQCQMLWKTLCQDLDTPISLGVYLRIKYGEWDSILAMWINPAHYLDTASGALKYFKDAQSVAFMKKYPELPIKRDLDHEAREKFFSLEKENHRTNQRLRELRTGFIAHPGDSFLLPLVDRIRKRIAGILGRLPDRLVPRFGKGAVYESKGHPFGSHLTVIDKMNLCVTLTESALALQGEIFASAWGRAVLRRTDRQIAVSRGSRFGTVRKDATKHRHINVEPGGNMALQLAVGKIVRSRLKRVAGIDLDLGQDFHRALARWSSVSDQHCTLDLSDASDLICRELVRLLLPCEWVALLEMLRSSHTEIKVAVKGSKQLESRWVLLEKFSSMGNGFTFELETLIFGSIAAELCGGWEDIWVYGDDMILPSEKGADVMAALRFFGLIPNQKKSFVAGPFRESCGGDFFAGYSVRPFYLDFDPKEPHEYITLANGLRRAAIQIGPMGRHSFHRIWHRVTGNIPSDIRRCVGPAALGDLVLHVSKWADHPHVTRSSIRYVRVWRPVPKRIRFSDARAHPEVQLAAILYGSAEGIHQSQIDRFTKRGADTETFASLLNGVLLTPRGGVSGYRFGRLAYS